MDAAQKQALERARGFEKAGQMADAIAAYKQAGAIEDAARLLIAAGRFAEAGPLLVATLGIADSSKIPTLDATKRKRALMAAICFANAKDTARAVDFFLKLGERGRAVETLQKAGELAWAARIERAPEAELATLAYAPSVRQGAAQTLAAAQKLERDGKLDAALQAYAELKQFGHAGRVAHQLKRPAQAAELFSEGGMPYEAAVCYLEAGDTGKCLECLVRVPREDQRYRNAAVHAIKLAMDLNVLDFQLEHFLGKFVQTGPLDDRELEAFYQLAALYRKQDFVENAKEALRKLLARNPAFRDAADKLAELESESRGSAMVYERIVREEQAFRQAVGQHNVAASKAHSGQTRVLDPDALPDLPDLPSLPPGAANLPVPSARPQPRLSGTVAASDAASARMAGTMAALPVTPGGAAAVRAPVPTPVPVAVPPSPSGVVAVGGPASSPGPAGASIQEGTLVADRYRLEKKIGQGGMAAVYRAHDMELEETIAIKFFSHLVADEQMVARFKQEVTLSRQLNHPNIIRLYDIGTFLDYKYITMELLTGSDLAKHMGGKPMAFAAGLDVLVQACNALEAVHAKGVVHRDIKPDNFFITKEGVLKVMDFGIAKRQGAASGMTRAGMIAGTPEYMSPEQINDLSSVTKLTDLYALGIMAYQMFTGTLPFFHEELMPLLVMQVTDKPEPPSKRNAAIPGALEAVILKLIEKDPKDRIQTCRELSEHLKSVRASLR